MYLVYLPDVGRPSEPLIQKDVGRGSSCVSDDEEEDQTLGVLGVARTEFEQVQ